MSRPIAVVAMSGGVDSSVAAALLVDRGFDVRGVSLRLWDSARTDARVCSDARDAARVAAALGIPHVTVDERPRFERELVRRFVASYADGATPNPCVACNGDFKFAALAEWARVWGAEVVASGHYARVAGGPGRRRLLRGTDAERDQSYFLFTVGPEALERALFPVGDRSKEEVRGLARRFGLPTAEKPDSQDLCFGSAAALVRARGRGGAAGEVVDEAGRVVGRHDGVERFTVGQRRGLGVAASAPLYVRAIDGRTNRVVVGRRPEARAVLASGWRWTAGRPALGQRLTAQVRYRHGGVPARVDEADGSRMRIAFDEPVVAAAPGQAVVVYRGDEVIGGGWIEQVEAA